MLCSLHVYRVTPWQNEDTHCGGNIVSYDVARPQQNAATLCAPVFQHFLSPGGKIFVRDKCCARETLSSQQCCRHNVSSFCGVLSYPGYDVTMDCTLFTKKRLRRTEGQLCTDYTLMCISSVAFLKIFAIAIPLSFLLW